MTDKHPNPTSLLELADRIIETVRRHDANYDRSQMHCLVAARAEAHLQNSIAAVLFIVGLAKALP